MFRTLQSALWALTIAAATGMGFPAVGHAATYDLDTECLFGFCGNVPSYGTVDITGGGASLTYAFNLSSGLLQQNYVLPLELSTIAMDFTGTMSSYTVTDATDTWTADAYGGNGLLGFFTNGFDCLGQGFTCGTTVTITISGSGLAAGFTPSLNGFQLLAGADISCANDSCETDPEVYASTTPLPGALPLFATGLGALGLFGWRRKRKNNAALAAA
jgi:hypothetical protein